MVATAPAAARSEPVATSEPPAGVPADVREAWGKVPFGRNKGQVLGEQSYELTYLAKECRMKDIQAAAKKPIIYRIEQ